MSHLSETKTSIIFIYNCTKKVINEPTIAFSILCWLMSNAEREMRYYSIIASLYTVPHTFVYPTHLNRTFEL